MAGRPGRRGRPHPQGNIRGGSKIFGLQASETKNFKTPPYISYRPKSSRSSTSSS